MTLRGDLALIANLINADARVLDLGCGTGELLANLQAEKNVNGYGLDKDPENIQVCLSKGVNVIEQDLDAGIAGITDFANHHAGVILICQFAHPLEERDVLRLVL